MAFFLSFYKRIKFFYKLTLLRILIYSLSI
nr:MAG TPA: hypothetical protein [Crassvirales sp.]